MKRLFLLFTIACFAFAGAIAQDSTWFKLVSHTVGLDSALGTRIMCADINGDNYPDLITGTGNINKNHIKIFLNVPNNDPGATTKRKFIDFTDSSGINKNRDATKTGRIVDVTTLADVDNDGDLDIVTSIYYHRLEYYAGTNDPGDRSEVYLNDGHGHFTLVQNSGITNMKLVDTLSAGLVNCTGLSFLDYDYDGKIDFYMSTWFSDYKSNQEINSDGYKMRDAILKGNGDGTFQLMTATGIEPNPQPMYGVNVTDWNNDGWPDVITSPYCRSGGSLFRNNKDGTFTDVSSSTGYTAQKMGGDNGQALCQWEALPGDFDNDGDMDLLQVNVHGGYNTGEGRTHVTINEGAKKNYALTWDLNRLKRDAPISTTHVSDDGGAWIDLDGDGKLDVLIGQTGYSDASTGTNVAGQCRAYFLLQDSLGKFNEITDKLGFKKILRESHSIEACDFDLDGDQDIFISHLALDTVVTADTTIIREYSRVELLENLIGNKSNWLSVKLYPPSNCNKSAIGARITAYYNGIPQIREVQAGNGHFAGQEPFIQNFSLGSERIDSIVVRWPNKELLATIVRNPEMNTIIEIDSNGKRGFIRTDANAYSLISFIEPHINFGTTQANSNATYDLVIKNTGNKALSLSSMSVNSDIAGVFTLSNPKILPINIEAGDTVHATIKFSPLARKNYAGNITINSDASNETKSIIKIKGYGFENQPIIAFNRDSVAFPTTTIDSVSLEKLTIKNIGELSLTINGYSFSGANAQYFTCSDTAKKIIAAGDSATISLSYSPKLLGSHVANLLVNSNSYLTENSLIPLSGKSQNKTPILSAKDTLRVADTKVGSNTDSVYVISNTGAGPLEISSIKVLATNGVFTLNNLILPLSVPANASYSLNVRFAPLYAKTYASSVLMQSNDVTRPTFYFTLVGTGKEPESVSEDCHCNSEFIPSIAPMPAKDYFTLKLRNVKDQSEFMILKLYSVTGALVMKKSVPINFSNEIEQRIDLPKLPAGMYSLSIQLANSEDNIPLIIAQ